MGFCYRAVLIVGHFSTTYDELAYPKAQSKRRIAKFHRQTLRRAHREGVLFNRAVLIVGRFSTTYNKSKHMTLEEIKAAVEVGKTVYWNHPHLVTNDDGHWLVKRTDDIGYHSLEHGNGSLSGDPEDYRIGEPTPKKEAKTVKVKAGLTFNSVELMRVENAHESVPDAWWCSGVDVVGWRAHSTEFILEQLIETPVKQASDFNPAAIITAARESQEAAARAEAKAQTKKNHELVDLFAPVLRFWDGIAGFPVVKFAVLGTLRDNLIQRNSTILQLRGCQSGDRITLEAKNCSFPHILYTDQHTTNLVLDADEAIEALAKYAIQAGVQEPK